MTTTNAVRNNTTLVVLSTAAAGILYLIATGGLYGEIKPPCNDCTCKMTYGWKSRLSTVAEGMQTQDAIPAKILEAETLQVKTCPDPPRACDSGSVVDKYEYQNFALTCNDNPNSLYQLEADVSGSGTRVQLNVPHYVCKNNNCN
jgi:hypothetical protein